MSSVVDAVYDARTLTDNEVYALSAYILSINKYRRERRDGRPEPAKGEDAERGQVHRAVPGPDLITSKNTFAGPAAICRPRLFL